MIRIMIVDDEEAAGNMLSILIRKYLPREHLICVEQDPAKALGLLNSFRPTVLMLDIEMPGMNGFDFLNRAGSWDFDVIFTTAFDRYAIKAIRFSALDYLLKPFDVVELQNALNRHVVRQSLSHHARKELVSNLIENVQRPEGEEYKLALSTNEGVFFYLPSDIIRCEGESNYTTFYLKQGKPVVVSKTLKEYELILTQYGFCRVHKSHLVNMKQVTRIDRDGFLWLCNGHTVPVSRRRKEEVLSLLKLN